jgi:hypothetical protein
MGLGQFLMSELLYLPIFLTCVYALLRVLIFDSMNISGTSVKMTTSEADARAKKLNDRVVRYLDMLQTEDLVSVS